jgi:hypothetical protein
LHFPETCIKIQVNRLLALRVGTLKGVRAATMTAAGARFNAQI